MEGGTRQPSDPAVVIRPSEKFSGYFAFVIAGRTMEPTAMSVTGELPEMAAKNIQATTAETASPPGIQPKAAMATRTSRRAIPPWVMIAPDIMKSGTARNSCFVIRSSIFWTTGSNSRSV